jgi:hypothetical protein
LLVVVMLAHGFDMMPPVHSEVLSPIVNMLLPVVHSAVTSPLLPFCLSLLLSLSLVVFLLSRSVQSAPSLLSWYSRSAY